MVLDPANGVAKGEGGCLLLQHVWCSALEEHDWEVLVHSCENGGEHRPVVECNRHNWCSVGVPTGFTACLEIEIAPFFCVYSVFLEELLPHMLSCNASWYQGCAVFSNNTSHYTYTTIAGHRALFFTMVKCQHILVALGQGNFFNRSHIKLEEKRRLKSITRHPERTW